MVSSYFTIINSLVKNYYLLLLLLLLSIDFLYMELIVCYYLNVKKRCNDLDVTLVPKFGVSDHPNSFILSCDMF